MLVFHQISILVQGYQVGFSLMDISGMRLKDQVKCTVPKRKLRPFKKVSFQSLNHSPKHLILDPKINKNHVKLVLAKLNLY